MITLNVSPTTQKPTTIRWPDINGQYQDSYHLRHSA